jgi:hypothetical protein
MNIKQIERDCLALIREYGDLHVSRIATWLGFILKAIQRLPNFIDELHIVGLRENERTWRQMYFKYRVAWFKVRYNHKCTFKGGIEILWAPQGPENRFAPDGDMIMTVTSLDDAENVYTSLQSRLDAFVAQLA